MTSARKAGALAAPGHGSDQARGARRARAAAAGLALVELEAVRRMYAVPQATGHRQRHRGRPRHNHSPLSAAHDNAKQQAPITGWLPRRAVVLARALRPPLAPALAGHLPAAAIRNVAEFLDVHVNQLAGALAFVAADDPASRPVQARQPGTAITGQHRVHGGRGQPEEGDPGRP